METSKARKNAKVVTVCSVIAAIVSAILYIFKDGYEGGDYLFGYLDGRTSAKEEEERIFDEETTRSIMKRAKNDKNYRKGAIFKDEE